MYGDAFILGLLQRVAQTVYVQPVFERKKEIRPRTAKTLDKKRQHVSQRRVRIVFRRGHERKKTHPGGHDARNEFRKRIRDRFLQKRQIAKTMDAFDAFGRAA